MIEGVIQRLLGLLPVLACCFPQQSVAVPAIIEVRIA